MENYNIKKRNGLVVSFNENKIRNALKNAFMSCKTPYEGKLDTIMSEVLDNVKGKDEELTVELVQDLVEYSLMHNGYYDIAREYIVYREEHKKKREKKLSKDIKSGKIHIELKDGRKSTFDIEILSSKITSLTKLNKPLTKVRVDELVTEICKTVYDNIKISEINKLVINTIKAKIEEHYDYSSLASRYLLNNTYENVLGHGMCVKDSTLNYRSMFGDYINLGVQNDIISKKLQTEFDLKIISEAIKPERDLEFYYLGMQTLMDRYLLKDKFETIYELPQWLWMRVAMGLALAEKKNKEEWAIKFYDILSKMWAVSSTPTLFNAGTNHPQNSSCYLGTTQDDLHDIFKAYSDSGQLSKWAGGIGWDWNNIRSKNSAIRGTKGKSQGLIPFLKIFNDVAICVNQLGKRKGAFATYIEPWHGDIEEYLELRKNSGDERRRAHDIHPALWIPDLFMKRVKENGDWTLFSPYDVADLHETYGYDFDKLYEKYEKSGVGLKTVKAVDLWKKILTNLFETGHPWICFKDPSNIRNPQQHCGVVHNSNLCTEIILNTSQEETAVCNLASINLSKMYNKKDKTLDLQRIDDTINIVVRMLDNVIDINFYPTEEAEKANKKHRPIGLGLMGYQDLLYQMKIDFDSDENVDLADRLMEHVSKTAIRQSCELAKEKGSYPSYGGSNWSKGIMPYDTLKDLEVNRGSDITVHRKTISEKDWEVIRRDIQTCGMRNSNVMAIAPTATISNIAGCVPCVEPIYRNLYVKENLSGNFVVVNRYLVDALSNQGLWTQKIRNLIKINNGSVLNIDEIPVEIRRRFKEVFEIEPKWIIECAARRAKWIDQSASTNIFTRTTSGKVLNDIYMMAWEKGLKTTYYLRTLGASQARKTVEEAKPEAEACNITDPECEACQ